MVIRKLGRIVGAAQKDAELARRTSHSPAFHREVAKDRRSALGQYRTVQHALRDRERLAAAKEHDKSAPPRRGKKA